MAKVQHSKLVVVFQFQEILFYFFLVILTLNRIKNSRQSDDGHIGEGRLHETISHSCFSSSAEYELALILKELRWITDQVSSKFLLNTEVPY